MTHHLQHPHPTLRRLVLLVVGFFLVSNAVQALEWQRGQTLHIACDTISMEPVVRAALQLFRADCRTVLDCPTTVENREQGDIVLQVDSRSLNGKWEAFRLQCRGERLYITGSDGHGLAYGLLEVSRLLGVSPWEWWADAAPKRLERFALPHRFKSEQAPDVQFRGIFINDEDWGLLPWASQTYEPTGVKGRIGPRTHSRIFELLLRLRANTFWPAMHECSEPFFLCDENREVARRYGIYIGTSHCEPMACNVNGEWRRRGEGEYDYVHNSERVRQFWEERVRDVAGQPVLYALGMRGVHDGAMQGARTVDEQRAVLERALADQRDMLRRHVNADLTRVPQVFIPYKEVLDVYNSGLSVPDDVCLMWCDDNYGYIHHFPTPEERRRPGGNGVYYHVSYWGRPHDYLWLGTFSPALLVQQMTQAYDYDMRRMWILNVGDLKPAEYQTELFMDMAWDMGNVRRQGVRGHLQHFLAREFGPSLAPSLADLLTEHYRLAWQCKPEFLGNTRTEESDRKYWNTVRDLPWTWTQIDQRLNSYQRIEDAARGFSAAIAPERRETYFQLVEYPLLAASQMNKKMLSAQRARHGLAPWAESQAAYDSIAVLTRQYNTDKWRGIMDFQPRRLAVFHPVDANSATGQLPTAAPLLTLQATDCTAGRYIPIEGLGYEAQAVSVPRGRSLTYTLPAGLTSQLGDSLCVEVRLLPNHATEGTELRFRLSLDGHATAPVNYETYGRSEEWKQNVLRNQAVRRLTLPVAPDVRRHRLTFQALDEGVVLDQIMLYTK